MGKIEVFYQAIDGCHQTRFYRTLKGAQKYAQLMIGTHPEIGRLYAISHDGIGKIMATGCKLADLFPKRVKELV